MDSYDDEAELWRYVGRWYNHLFTDDERFGPTVQRLRELCPDASVAEIEAIVNEHHDGRSESRSVARELLRAVDDLNRRAFDRICREHAHALLINSVRDVGGSSRRRPQNSVCGVAMTGIPKQARTPPKTGRPGSNRMPRNKAVNPSGGRADFEINTSWPPLGYRSRYPYWREPAANTMINPYSPPIEHRSSRKKHSVLRRVYSVLGCAAVALYFTCYTINFAFSRESPGEWRRDMDVIMVVSFGLSAFGFCVSALLVRHGWLKIASVTAFGSLFTGVGGPIVFDPYWSPIGRALF